MHIEYTKLFASEEYVCLFYILCSLSLSPRRNTFFPMITISDTPDTVETTPILQYNFHNDYNYLHQLYLVAKIFTQDTLHNCQGY